MSKKNCWDYMDCGKGPNSDTICPAAKHEVSHGYLKGKKGGRACFYIKDTLCKNGDEPDEGNVTEKLLQQCLQCEFFRQVQLEEGVESNIFYYLKHLHENGETEAGNFNLLLQVNNGEI